jgi:FMN phosphatase YigB (HAD superfamily)
MAGLQVGLLSNFSTELRTLLHQQDLFWRFHGIAISAEIGVMKPAAAAYQAILSMLGVAAPTAVFIDDLPENVAAAATLGIHGIVFHDTPSCLRDLHDLLGPHIIAPSPDGRSGASF